MVFLERRNRQKGPTYREGKRKARREKGENRVWGGWEREEGREREAAGILKNPFCLC